MQLASKSAQQGIMPCIPESVATRVRLDDEVETHDPTQGREEVEGRCLDRAAFHSTNAGTGDTDRGSDILLTQPSRDPRPASVFDEPLDREANPSSAAV